MCVSVVLKGLHQSLMLTLGHCLVSLPEGNVVVQNTFTSPPGPALPDVPFAVEQTAQEACDSVYI